MKRISWLPALAILATLGGCSNLERSRDLSNPMVSPAVTAVQVCSNCHGVDGNSISPTSRGSPGNSHRTWCRSWRIFEATKDPTPRALSTCGASATI